MFHLLELPKRTPSRNLRSNQCEFLQSVELGRSRLLNALISQVKWTVGALYERRLEDTREASPFLTCTFLQTDTKTLNDIGHEV